MTCTNPIQICPSSFSKAGFLFVFSKSDATRHIPRRSISPQASRQRVPKLLAQQSLHRRDTRGVRNITMLTLTVARARLPSPRPSSRPLISSLAAPGPRSGGDVPYDIRTFQAIMRNTRYGLRENAFGPTSSFSFANGTKQAPAIEANHSRDAPLCHLGIRDAFLKRGFPLRSSSTIIPQGRVRMQI